MISVVIAHRYNPKRNYLGKTFPFLNIKLSLNSLLHSNKYIKEIILVNNSIMEVDPQLLFIKNNYSDKIKIIDNKLKYDTFNKSWLLNIGIKNCTQKFFMMHDIDCILNPEFDNIFYDNMKYLENNFIHFDLFQILPEKINDYNWENFNFYSIKEDIFHYESPSHIICDLNILKNIKGYNEYYENWGYEDEDLNLRLKNIGLELYKTKTYHIHQNHANPNRELDPYKNINIFNAKKNNVNNCWGEISGPYTKNLFNKL